MYKNIIFEKKESPFYLKKMEVNIYPLFLNKRVIGACLKKSSDGLQMMSEILFYNHSTSNKLQKHYKLWCQTKNLSEVKP